MRLTIRTDYEPLIAEWQAIADEYYDDATDAGWVPVGRGRTEAEAIADLKEQIREHEED